MDSARAEECEYIRTYRQLAIASSCLGRVSPILAAAISFAAIGYTEDSVDPRMEHLGRNKEPMRKVGQNVREKTRKLFFITYPDMVDLELVLQNLEKWETDSN